ncbi:MAG: hypothetical protein LBP26_06355 [Clostridiales bacterium]|jgi:hypothetical protein|nr:hypothetical protein [Clostridiales bacterium]
MDNIKKASILFSDFTPVGDITSDVREQNSKRVFTGGVRINRALYRTSNEYERYRQSVLDKKLP